LKERLVEEGSHLDGGAADVDEGTLLPGAFEPVDLFVFGQLEGLAEPVVEGVDPPAVIAQPSSAQKPSGPVRALNIRVYADDEYRSQTLRWQDKFDAQIARVNQILTPAFGVRIEIADMLPWDRSANSSDLVGALEELERHDPAEGVDWVVGLVTSLPQVTASMHMLGAARPLGRHMVLRGMNDVAERAMIEEVFDSISAEEREQLYHARKAHKEVLIFLHEWAHTFGALHNDTPSAIMNASYDSGMTQFTPANARIIQIGLPFVGGGDRTGIQMSRWNERLLAYFEGADPTAWRQPELNELVAILRQGPAPVPELTVSAELTPQGRKQFYQALDFERSGRPDDALRVALPLTELYDTEPEVQLLGCRLAARVKGAAYPTPKLCGRAAELAPESPIPSLALAGVYLAGDARDRGIEALRDALDRLTSSDDPHPEQWQTLVVLCQRESFVTWAEQSAAHLDDADVAASVQDWVGQTRRRYALAPGALPPEREPDYIEAVKRVLSLTYGNQAEEARRLAEAGLEQFDRAPGFYVALCDLHLRDGRDAQARRMCQRALARYDEAVWAHYLMGSLEANRRRFPASIRHLQRAIEIEPTLQPAWRTLAKLYGHLDRQTELDTLRKRYQEQFNAPL